MQKKIDTATAALTAKQDKRSEQQQQADIAQEELPAAKEAEAELQTELDQAVAKVDQMRKSLQGEVCTSWPAGSPRAV